MATIKKLMSFLGKYFGVITKGRTYLNLIYLSLVFPLGLLYFVYLITGLSLSAGLLILIISIPFILVFVLSWWGFIHLERLQAHYLLGIKLDPINGKETRFFSRCWEWIRHPLNWKGLLFLLIKFPFGIVTFVIGTILLSIVSVLIAAPFYYSDAEIYEIVAFGKIIDTLPEALLVSLIGLALLFPVLHICNAVAFVWKKMSELLLNHTVKTPVVTP